MYEEFYGLAEAPFNITPDPRYLFFSRFHRDAYEHVLFGLQRRRGFIQLTGEVGSGKTTLCRAILSELGPEWSTALVLNPMMTGIQLLRTLLRELGLDGRGNDRIRLLERLNDHLLERATAGEDVAVFIDEAQDMPGELLEEVRLLSNLETDDRKLLQIVLVGQPELRDVLGRPQLRQLAQRVLVRSHLGALDRHETEAYIRHRLAVAGSTGRPTFTPAAIRAIHRWAGGIPRRINALCDGALLAGWVDGRDSIGRREVRRSVQSLHGSDR